MTTVKVWIKKPGQKDDDAVGVDIPADSIVQTLKETYLGTKEPSRIAALVLKYDKTELSNRRTYQSYLDESPALANATLVAEDGDKTASNTGYQLSATLTLPSLAPVDDLVQARIQAYIDVKGLSYPFMESMDVDNVSDNSSCSRAAIDELKSCYNNEFSDLANVLVALAGLDIPVLQYPRSTYVPKSDYVKTGLPTMVSTPALDLRMLEYDVYSQRQQETEVVQQTLKVISRCDSLPYANPHVFLAGHAFGKTKSLLDIARHRYTIYLDISANHHIDIADMKSRIKDICNAETQTNVLEQKCAYEVNLTLSARMVSLQLALAKTSINPECWRDLQLNGFVSLESGTLTKIRQFIRYHFRTLNELRMFTKHVAEFHYLKHGTRLVCSIDEANILLSLHRNMFSRPSDPKIVDRALWSCFGTEIAQILPISVIVAGTRIHLRDTEVFKSSLAKFGTAAGQELITLTNFRVTSVEQALLLCNKLFRNMNIATKTTIANKLCVRSRYITAFADYLEEKEAKQNQSVLSLLDEYIALLVSSDRNWSIKSQLLTLYKEHANTDTFIRDVCRLVKVYLIAGGTLENPSSESVDWMAGGICYVEHTEKISYKITEPNVIEAIQLFITEMKGSFAAYMATEMTQNTNLDDTAIGVMFDAVVAASILEQRKCGIFPSFFSQIPWANGTRFSFSSVVPKLPLEEYLESRGHEKGLLCQNSAGPDVWFLAVPIEMRIANKISLDSLRKNHTSVDTRFVQDNYNKTLTPNIYSEVHDDGSLKTRPQYIDRLKRIFRWYEENKLNGSIRVHIVLPRAADTGAPTDKKLVGQHNFVPGRIRLGNRQITVADDGIDFTLPEAVVDIDASCIQMCNLFPNSVIKILCDMFPQQQKAEWVVESAEEDFVSPMNLVSRNISEVATGDDDVNLRFCERCGALYKKDVSSSVPYCKLEDGICVVKYCCEWCRVNKSSKAKIPDGRADWDGSLKTAWHKFISLHLGFTVGSDIVLIQRFFDVNHVKLMEGDVSTFSNFASSFAVPAQNKPKRQQKRKK